MRRGPASTAVPGGVRTGHVPSRPTGRGTSGHTGGTASAERRLLCREMQWPQGTDRRLLSDLAVPVEGGISVCCGLLLAPAAEPGGCHRAGLGLGSRESAPTSLPASDSMDAAAEVGQGGC